ncbi:oxidoreductase C-terminal domain-containing protein [Nocardiopsis xinjiangensis]|uniref:oxidoreductase C-terminal domain-containing protein n=1 Tax=Nocardiopsis xinjiangensis TaxID=124285 RepID=UPI0023A9E209|nr:oxidoreductase C-terminal domain-containing protein [Nocardiopsis xinjiangensis]
MRPATDWLAGSGLEVNDGVVCDSGLVTSAPNVVAVGDVARYRSSSGQLVRHEHWTNASEQPRTAVQNLLAGATVNDHRPSRYMWSDQYGCRLQVAGRTEDADEVEVVEGSEESRKFVAAYRRDGTTTGVFAMNDPKLFTRMRRTLLAPVAT